VRPTLREALADSHIAAVAIAVLLVWSLDSGVRALWPPLVRGAEFLVVVVAIRGIPYGSGNFTLGDWIMLVPTLAYLFSAIITLGAAWSVSHWVYGTGPLCGLSKSRTSLARRTHA